MNISKPFFSIIVPVYNSATFLPKTLDSLRNQSFNNFEVILINDGSTDESLSILQRYAQIDARFKVFSQINSGQGTTRNYALSLAKGEYISFVDSDDYMHNINAYNILFNSLKFNPKDIMFFGYKKIYSSSKSFYAKILNTVSSKTSTLKLLSKQRKLLKTPTITTLPNKKKLLLTKNIGGPWNKVYNRQFLIDNNIKFAESIKFEDALLFWGSIALAHNIGFCNNFLYTYRKHKSSTMKTINSKTLDIISIYQQIAELLKFNGLLEEYSDSLLIRALPSFFKQFKKTKLKNKPLFFYQAQSFIHMIPIEKAKLLRYNKVYKQYKMLKNLGFMGFLIRSYFN